MKDLVRFSVRGKTQLDCMRTAQRVLSEYLGSDPVVEQFASLDTRAVETIRTASGAIEIVEWEMDVTYISLFDIVEPE